MDKWSIAKSTPLRLKREELYDKIGVWFHSQGREVPFEECYQQVVLIATEIGYSTAKLKEKYVRDFIYRHLAREYRLKKGEIRPRAATLTTQQSATSSSSTPPTIITTTTPNKQQQKAVTTIQQTIPTPMHIHHQQQLQQQTTTELQPTLYQNTVPVHFMPIFRNSIEFA